MRLWIRARPHDAQRPLGDGAGFRLSHSTLSTTSDAPACFAARITGATSACVIGAGRLLMPPPSSRCPSPTTIAG